MPENIYDPDRIIVSMDPYFEHNFLVENAKIEARSRIVNQFSRSDNSGFLNCSINQALFYKFLILS